MRIGTSTASVRNVSDALLLGKIQAAAYDVDCVVTLLTIVD
jgi:hypothetical protein